MAGAAGLMMPSLALIVLFLVSAARGAPIRSDEEVLFLPSMGYRSADGMWKLEVNAWAFERERRRASLAVFRKALGLDADEMSQAEREMFTQRARPFLQDNHRGKQITILLGGQRHELGRTGANGRLADHLALAEREVQALRAASDKPGSVIRFSASLPAADLRTLVGEVHLLEAEGLSVISDIDDTIKVSHVSNRKALLRSTFIKPFEPVPGMAQVYQQWAAKAGAQFHYVSASPWQLYEPLAGFIRTNGYPAGTFHLKDFRWKDQSFFNLFGSPEDYKAGVIGPLLERFPQRRFVLVGDSGEKDPEIYARLARAHPAQVARIFIREVAGGDTNQARYQAAFAGLPPGMWTVFRTPAEIEGINP